MRIVSTSPASTKFLVELGVGAQLVGVSHLCVVPEEFSSVVRVTRDGPRDGIFSDFAIDEEALARVQPTHLCALLQGDPSSLEFGREQALSSLRESLHQPELVAYVARPSSLEELYTAIEELGAAVDKRIDGAQFRQKLRAQFTNWADAFYDRMKGRRVTVLSSIEPLRVAGDWIPDLITLASATSQAPKGTVTDAPTSWERINEFQPDVLIVAPRGKSMKEVLSTFKQLEKLPHWENLRAVKRGDVFFCDGALHFYDLSHSLRESVAVLFSCIAGLESGYITPRESFYRLRWLELQRHRIS